MQIRRFLYPMFLGLYLISCSPAKPEQTNPYPTATQAVQVYATPAEQKEERKPYQIPRLDLSQIKSPLDAYIMVGEELSKSGDHALAGYIFGSALEYTLDDKEFKQLKFRASEEYAKTAENLRNQKHLSEKQIEEIEKFMEAIISSENDHVRPVKEFLIDNKNLRRNLEELKDCDSIERSADFYSHAFGFSAVTVGDNKINIDTSKEAITYAREYARKSLQAFDDTAKCMKTSNPFRYSNIGDYLEKRKGSLQLMLDFYLIEGGTPADTYLRIARRFNELGAYLIAKDFFSMAADYYFRRAYSSMKSDDRENERKMILEKAQSFAKAAEAARQRKELSKDQIRATVKLLEDLSGIEYKAIGNSHYTYEDEYNEYLLDLRGCGNLYKAAFLYRLALVTAEPHTSSSGNVRIDTSKEYAEYAQKLLEAGEEALACLDVGELPRENESDARRNLTGLIKDANDVLYESKKK